MILYELKFPNSKKYYGITSKTVAERFRAHCNTVGGQRQPVHHAIHKYGKGNVTISEILTLTNSADSWELLCLAEQEIIEKARSIGEGIYNISNGGDGNPKVTVFGEERKQRDEQLKKQYLKRNKESLAAKRQVYRAKNAERIKRNNQIWRERNKEYLRSKRRPSDPEYMKEYRERNRERLLEHKRQFYAENKEDILRKRDEARAKLSPEAKKIETPQESAERKAKRHEYYLKNREHILARQKQTTDIEARNAKSRKYYAENKERIQESRKTPEFIASLNTPEAIASRQKAQRAYYERNKTAIAARRDNPEARLKAAQAQARHRERKRLTLKAQTALIEAI